MRLNILLFCIILLGLLYGCNLKQQPQGAASPQGELAFLLQYNGKMPSDVGLLRNQVVQRRLANMLKDSFQVFINSTKYERPIEVSLQQQLVMAEFFSDSDRSQPSANLTIDVQQDAMWVEYLSGDSIIEFTDHKSLPRPGVNAD